MWPFKKKYQQLSLPLNTPTQDDKKLIWEEVKCKGFATRLRRAKVPGGWLLAVENTFGLGMSFYPDAKHEWTGRSLQ